MIRNFLALSSLFFLVACGSSSSLSGSYEVDDVNILAKNISIGESVRVEVFFQTKREFDGTPDGLELVVLLPPALRYVAGSSEIYDGTTDERDGRSPDKVVTCEDGGAFLIYQFSDSDLEDRGLGSSSDFGLRFNVEGVSKATAAYVSASAGESVEYRCGSTFSSEEQEAVEVM